MSKFDRKGIKSTDMQTNSNQKEPTPLINITPLIDVLLVLLIIFMVAAPMRPARFEAKIPAEQQKPDLKTKPNPDSLIVSINEKLEIKLNKDDAGSLENLGKLNAELARIFEIRRQNGVYRTDALTRTDLSEDEKIQKTVFIKAPRTISYGVVAKLIDGVRETGANPVGLQIDGLD